MTSQLNVDTAGKPQKSVPPAAIKLLTPKEAAEGLINVGRFNAFEAAVTNEAGELGQTGTILKPRVSNRRDPHQSLLNPQNRGMQVHRRTSAYTAKYAEEW
jgi:hypothetical protein